MKSRVLPLAALLARTRAVCLQSIRARGWTDADLDSTIEVDPAQVVHYQDINQWRHPRIVRYAPEQGVDARRFVVANSGKVVAGDWDLQRTPFEQNNIYRLLREHFVDGVPWEETAVFRKFAGEIAAGKLRWRWSASTEEMMQAARESERLFESMSANGYRPNGSSDPIVVSIGRAGELLYNNVGGHHRLSIAKILGLESIPVRVLLRHRYWQDLRNELLRGGGRQEPSPRVREHLRHPDLESLLR